MPTCHSRSSTKLLGGKSSLCMACACFSNMQVSECRTQTLQRQHALVPAKLPNSRLVYSQDRVKLQHSSTLRRKVRGVIQETECAVFTGVRSEVQHLTANFQVKGSSPQNHHLASSRWEPAFNKCIAPR